MATFYLVLEILALLGVIVIPLSGPKKNKNKKANELSSLYVNENGFLEYYYIDKDTDEHHPVL